VRCPDCKRPMTALFTSYVCDYCDGLVEIAWQRGFVVFRGDADFNRVIYVFPTMTDAARYRSVNGWQDYPIREVWFEIPVPWKTASNQLEGVSIAVRPFTLHRDHRFESAPYHAFLVPLRSNDFAA
jgi:hypothetical protein